MFSCNVTNVASGANEKAQLGKAPNSEHLDLTPGPRWCKERTDSHKLSSDLHVIATVCAHTNKQTSK